MTGRFAQFYNPWGLVRWFGGVLFWWVRARIVPENPKETINLKSDPVVYVLHHRSLSDFLLLYFYCRKLGMPLPRVNVRRMRLNQSRYAGFLSLQKLGLFQPVRTEDPPTPLLGLCKRLSQESDVNVQLLPVSIIWGRNPGKEERSLFKLLFPDDEHAGILQKIFIVLAQGRDVLMHFGTPISMREQVDAGPDINQVARKLRRVLRVHFRNQRNLALGPKMYDRHRMISQVFHSKAMQAAMDQEVQKSKLPRSKVEEKAWYYLKEMAAQQNHSIVRFFEVLLNYIWNKIYNGIVVKNSEGLRELVRTHEVVYVPSHRSHLDYLILLYQIYVMGMTPPHSAAGVNLNFWPVGPFLRRGGAFFIRRSFRGNRLYSVAFTEYLNVLLNKGHPIIYFPEGGRSRTGKLLSPKTGLLSMIVQSYMRSCEKPLALVPVFIGYDKVAEVATYLNELRGSKKKSESFFEFLKVRKVLKADHGSAYLSFGKPLLIDPYMDKAQPDWRQIKMDGARPPWFTKLVNEIAIDAMKGINTVAVASPVAIVALALLTSPQRAVAEDELLELIDTLIKIMEGSTLRESLSLPDKPASELLSYAEEVAPISRFKYPGGEGDVIFLDEVNGPIMTYYRNNILHLYALPSLIASHFHHQDTVNIRHLQEGVAEIYPFLESEFFLPWDRDTVASEVNGLIEVFIERGLLFREGESLNRPDVATKEFSILKRLGPIMGLVFERHSISAALLASLGDGQAFERKEFEQKCQILAQRISILNGITDPEFYDSALFRRHVDSLKVRGYIKEVDGSLLVDGKIEKLVRTASCLLSPDMWQSIQRMTRANEDG